jgi:hypothetical protein
MPVSRASIFGEAEGFQAALSADGAAGLLVTGHGQFRARLTQVELDRLRLTAVEEAQPRMAFVTVPAGMVLTTAGVAGLRLLARDGPLGFGDAGSVTIRPQQRLRPRPRDHCSHQVRHLLFASFPNLAAPVRGRGTA